ncbi:hypothetical protein HPB47_022732 [Ixodes persulcatus]|uniref:Uncharacterized protein n=1 Tax=Ixodes persulcatus TaxID=34615 RepID=A0AC60QA07_IXOPE|nr:hypothetical protein HPB47_022732 [Ixodes persulcatus]
MEEPLGHAVPEPGKCRTPQKKRTTLRAATTKVINEIGALLTSDPTEIGELEEKLDILLLKEASLKELDREIEPSVEDEALAEEGRTLLRLLLDGGSQRTFVRRDISERLHLRMLGEEDVRIFTFGGNATTNPTKCRRVELWLRSRFDRKEVRVEALEVPCICADLVMAPSEVVVTQMKMEGMNIADSHT